MPPATPDDAETPRRPFRVRPIRGALAPGFDPRKVKEFLDDLDVEHVLEVQRRNVSEGE